MIQVEVTYALPDRQWLLQLEVPQGTRLLEAVQRSGISEQVPGLVLTQLRFGVFGRVMPAEHVLADGERVELYRPLTINPKAARRKRAAQAG